MDGRWVHMGSQRVWVDCCQETSERDLRDLARLLLNRWESLDRPVWDVIESL